MGRLSIGETAMTATERSRRRRDKAKALRDAEERSWNITAPQPDQANGGEPRFMHQAGKPSADYPRMLYHADGRTMVVQTPEEHDQLQPEGWGTVPPASRPRAVTSYGVLGAVSDPLVETLRQVIREEVRAVLSEELDQHDLSRAD